MPNNHLFAALARVSKFSPDHRIGQIVELTAKELGAKVAAVWRYNPMSGHCSCFARYGYEGNKTRKAEFVLEFDGSLISELVSELNQTSASHAERDLTVDDMVDQHWAPDVIRNLKLNHLVAIPFYNLALPAAERGKIRGLIIYYFSNKPDVDDAISSFLTSTYSDLYGSRYLTRKDEVTDQVIDVFVRQSAGQSSSELLDAVCSTICVETIGVEACSIYEWSAHHSGYRLVATTGLQEARANKEVIDRRGCGLLSAVAEQSRPLAFENILDRGEVEREIGSKIDPEILSRNIEKTVNPYSAAMFIPVLNPIASKERFPTAIIKFVNKRHRMADFVDFFDIEDQLLGEEIARMIALYEEQMRALRQQEAFALQFGHEARAPAVGIRGTADRILYRIDKGDWDKKELIASMAQDIFDFSEIMISFAESLNFGFGDRNISRQLRYKFRQTNIRKCVESAQKVVIPICRDEQISIGNIRIFGTFPLIFIDSRAFMQVFYNLMTNAIKYRVKEKPGQFSIQISSRFIDDPEDLTNQAQRQLWEQMQASKYIRKGAYVVDFSDFGIGILGEEVTRVFWDGYRSLRASAQDIRGSGVGLTIVRNILADFDCVIWVEQESEPTVLRIMIPDFLESSNYARGDKARTWRNV
jgi:signal transduction histidine kinase